MSSTTTPKTLTVSRFRPTSDFISAVANSTRIAQRDKNVIGLRDSERVHHAFAQTNSEDEETQAINNNNEEQTVSSSEGSLGSNPGGDLVSDMCGWHCLQCVQQYGRHYCLTCEEGFYMGSDHECYARNSSYGESEEGGYRDFYLLAISFAVILLFLVITPLIVICLEDRLCSCAYRRWFRRRSSTVTMESLPTSSHSTVRDTRQCPQQPPSVEASVGVSVVVVTNPGDAVTLGIKEPI